MTFVFLLSLLYIFDRCCTTKYRKSWDHCARAGPTKGANQINQDYEQPTVIAETAVTNDDNDDTNEQYAELDDPNFTGYKNQI